MSRRQLKPTHTNQNLLCFRSKKYLTTTPAPPPPVNPPSVPQQPSVEQESTPSLDLSSTQIQPISHPAATSSPQQPQSLSQAREATESLDQESGPMLYLSESLQESIAADGAHGPGAEPREDTSTPQKQSQAAVMSDSDELQKEPILGAVVEAVVEPHGSTNPAAAVQPLTKPREDKLARLKKLGLDPPPVAKLCPDSVAFVELEPPQLNPGEM